MKRVKIGVDDDEKTKKEKQNIRVPLSLLFCRVQPCDDPLLCILSHLCNVSTQKVI